MTDVQVTLGEHTYGIKPQRIGRLADRLGERFNTLVDAELGGEGASQLAVLGQGAHDILRVFIPNLMPVHEFLGYGSPQALEAGGERDPETDFSPTFPEIRNAFETAFRVNGFEVFGHLKALVGPELLQKMVAAKVSETLTAGSAGSQNSARANGASASQSSGTDAPTSAPMQAAEPFSLEKQPTPA